MRSTVTKEKYAVVVGAGLAGCSIAYALNQRGFKVRLLERGPCVASGASRVRQAVLYPDLSVHASPVTNWMQHAFLFATRQYRTWLHKNLIKGELNGILQFRDKAASKLATLVSRHEASHLAGIEVASSALFVEDAGWLDTSALCTFLINRKGIEFEPNTTVQALDFDAPVVVLANGMGACSFSETAHFPLEAVSGQMTAIKSRADSSALKLPICGHGHVLPAVDGMHWTGASYARDDSCILTEKDNLDNLAKLTALPIANIWSDEICDAWRGVRVKTPDYLPLVGLVPDALLSETQRKLQYYSGLYVLAGFGSRGLTSIPLAASYLAGMIAGEASSIPEVVARTLSPARFLMKRMKGHLRTSKRTL